MAEETNCRPKAMVDVAGRPILWHVMQMYAGAGLNDFIVAVGYRGDVIGAEIAGHCPSHWRIECVDTGEDTASGGRLLRLKHRLGDAPFVLSWCDGVADLDVPALLAFHRGHGKLATVVAVHPPSRFGRLGLAGERVVRFAEKGVDTDAWVSGGMFVLEAEALDVIADAATPWEQGPLAALAEAGQLMAYRHEGFWQCMDTVAERDALASLWRRGIAPWKRET